MNKTVITINLDSLEKVVTSQSIIVKSGFVVMAPHQVFALVPKDDQNKKEFNHVSQSLFRISINLFL